MATDSSQSTTILSSFSIPITEKLSKSNYHLWQAQILPMIRVAQMDDLLMGIKKAPPKTVHVPSSGDNLSVMPNPEYARWHARDQALLSFLFSSVTHKVVTGIRRVESSVVAWSTS
jgi:hypothetical protein